MSSDRKPVQAAGGEDKGRPDGVSQPETSGRGGGGESGGGAYPNPHSGKAPEKDGLMGHGGQTDMNYHGTGALGRQKIPGQANANAPATKEEGGGVEKGDD